MTVGAPARAAEDGIEAPLDDVEPPAQIAPDDAEEPSEDELIEPDELDPGAAMRPDVKQGGEGGAPAAIGRGEQAGQARPSLDDLPLQSPVDKAKMLAELYEQLGKAADAEAARRRSWRRSRISGGFRGATPSICCWPAPSASPRKSDLDLALKIVDATVDMAPDDAEAWHLRAKIAVSQKGL